MVGFVGLLVGAVDWSTAPGAEVESVAFIELDLEGEADLSDC